MNIINVTNGSAAFGGRCQVCDSWISVPSTVLGFTYYDDAYGDIDGYICKSCVDKTHELMKDSTPIKHE